MQLNRLTVTSAGPSNAIQVLQAPFNVSSPTQVRVLESIQCLSSRISHVWSVSQFGDLAFTLAINCMYVRKLMFTWAFIRLSFSQLEMQTIDTV